MWSGGSERGETGIAGSQDQDTGPANQARHEMQPDKEAETEATFHQVFLNSVPHKSTCLLRDFTRHLAGVYIITCLSELGLGRKTARGLSVHRRE